jgi:hypothetical protein
MHIAVRQGLATHSDPRCGIQGDSPLTNRSPSSDSAAPVKSGSNRNPVKQMNSMNYLLTNLNRSSYTLRCRGFFFFILIILQTVGLLVRVISSSQGLYLNIGQHKHRINTYTNMRFLTLITQ